MMNILEDLKLSAPSENGLVKETLSRVKSSPKKEIFRNRPPKTKQKTSILKRRVRIGAEKRRYMQTIEASENKNSKKAKLVQELAPENVSVYHIYIQNT